MDDRALVWAMEADGDAGDPLALLRLPEAAHVPRFYWWSPDTRRGVSAFGVTHGASAAGADRLQHVSRECRTTRDAMAGNHARSALWIGGFAFEPRVDPRGPWSGFPAAWFALPWAAVAFGGEGGRLSTFGRAGPNDLRRRTSRLAERLVGAETAAAGPMDRRDVVSESWSRLAASASADCLRRRIERALAAIQRGDVRKVVIATKRTVRLARAVDPVALLAAVRDAEPRAYHFLVSPRPGCAFVGATPERLVRVDGDRAWATALAGSTGRAEDPAADGALGAALLASAKDRVEHDLVAEAVRGTLEQAGHRVEAQDGPGLRRMSRVQHLETTMRVHLVGTADVLAEAERLHPTPALGGVPRNEAAALISELEGEPRGWYGGGIGCIDGTGNGEIAVAIRSLLLRDDTVTAWAGAGIVDGSDPDAEAAEVRLKLEATLAPLLG